jgi:hypothetical protein
MRFRLEIGSYRVTVASCAALACLAVFAPLARANAQGTAVGVIGGQPSDSAHLAAAMAASQRMRSPASFALANRSELLLTPEQVSYLEALVKAEADSQGVRTKRMMDRLQEAAHATDLGPMREAMRWTGPVDEAAIRAAVCEQSKAQADLMIGMIQDRHAVGGVLTEPQQAMMDRLQVRLMRSVLGQP